MKHVLLVLGALVAGSTLANADIIQFEARVVLAHRTAPDILGSIGADTLGLDGATLVFRAAFDTSDTYIDRFNQPFVESIANSLTITGASVASTNGVRSAAHGVGLYPINGGQYYPFNGLDTTWDVEGSTLSLLSLTNAVPGISVGDNVALSHFSTTQRIRPAQFDYGLFFVGSLVTSARYDATSFSASVTPIPEPGTLTLLSLGAVVAIWLRRRRAVHARTATDL